MDAAHGSGLRERRLAEVDGLLTARDGAVDGPTGHGLSTLWTRLRHVHARCESVDAAAWAGYVTDLDRGIDALHAGVARAAQQPVAGPTVDDVLLARTAELELRAGRVTVDAGPDRPGVRAALADAEVALAGYREELRSAGPPSRPGLETAMDRLRRAGSAVPAPARPVEPAP
ncbi:hypothetical protein [Geodermatophilus sp. SYSU D00710]